MEPKAVLTFFSLSGCGHCKVYKGEKVTSTGQTVLDPNSGWNTLCNDPDLKAAGVKFVLYQVGDVKDPSTGKITRYELEPEFKGKIRGFPHLRLTRPDDRFGGYPMEERISGWAASQSVPVIKKWILQKLQDPAFVAPKNTRQPVQTTSGFANQQGYPQKGSFVVRQDDNRQSQVPEARALSPAEMSQTSANQRPPATVFGLGTRQVPIIPREKIAVEPVVKPPRRFLPSNSDEL